MMPFIRPLASGSLGNALLVRSEKAALLVDAGIGQRRLAAALVAAGTRPDDLQAVLLTHTHGDHFAEAAAGFCFRHGVPVYSTPENLEHLVRVMQPFRKLQRAGLARPIDNGPVQVADVTAESFSLPHDAPGTCLGFRLMIGPARRRRVVSIATDLGHVPPGCLRNFLDADAVVLESNHDPVMLARSGRPLELIARIAGPAGHLANQQAAEALAEILGRSHAGRVQHVVLAHLSRDCNTPRLALEAQAHLARRAAHMPRLFAAGQFEPGPLVQM